MSEIVAAAVAAMSERLDGKSFAGTAKFVITGEGSLVIDGAGARASDEEAEVTLTADADTFHSILSGDLNPTAAFMTGKLSVDGNMGLAMQLASVLA
jgi:putative sterol carrier protein